MHAMILAAGFGQRLRPHTEVLAKPALPLLNIPMLGYSLYLLEQVGLSHLALNTHHLPETVEKAVNAVSDDKYQVQIYQEKGEILGSGGGIRNAQASLQEADDFFSLNGDNLCLFQEPNPLQDMLTFHKEKAPLATIMVYPHPEVGNKFNGVWINSDNEVKSFGKTPDSEQYKGFHFTGILLLNHKVFDWLPEGESNIIYDVLVPAIQAGEKVFGFQPQQIQWFETGNEADYLKAHWACLNLLGESNDYALPAILDRFTPHWRDHALDGFCSATDFNSTKGLTLKGRGLIGQNCRIGSDVTLNNVVLGDKCQIGSGCQLENTVVRAGLSIADETRLENSLIVK